MGNLGIKVQATKYELSNGMAGLNEVGKLVRGASARALSPLKQS